MIDKPEQCLVEAAQNGCVESFGALYGRYYGPMVAVAYSVLADSGLAEDAAQQTFVIACSELSRIKRSDRFAAWLAGICRNVARQMRRSKDKDTALLRKQPAGDKDFENEQRDAVRQVVWKLGASDREPIVLRFYNGLSYAQIATVLGISEQAVNGRLIRAKRKIEKYLERSGFSGGDYEKS